MKLVKILSLAFGLILLVSAAGMAQTSMTTTFANIQIAPNAQTGLVGEVDFVPLISGGTIPAGESITVTYSSQISSLSDLRVLVLGCTQPFAVTGTAGATAFGTAQNCTGTNTPTVTVAVNTTLSTITIAVGNSNPATPASIATTLQTQFARFTGVRVNVAAQSLAVGSLVNATVTNSVGIGTITNNLVPVATVAEPISFTGATFPAVAQTGGTTTQTLYINELFTNAFETKTAGALQATEPTLLNVTIAPPTGFTLVTTGFFSGMAIAGTGASGHLTTFSTTALTIAIDSQNAQSLDTLNLPLSFYAPGPVPLAPGSIAFTVTLAPPAVGASPWIVAPDTVNGSGVVTVAGAPLRYTSRPVALTVAIASTIQQNTTLYSVFNVVTPSSDTVVGFNTGFAIANTSGTGPLGNGGAQPGAITVTLYPADGSTPKFFTTSATIKPGTGLDANGLLPASATWNVLLSELISAAGFTGTSFQGQATFFIKSPCAHGINFIADPTFSVTSQGYPMLVIYSDSSNPLSKGFEN